MKSEVQDDFEEEKYKKNENDINLQEEDNDIDEDSRIYDNISSNSKNDNSQESMTESLDEERLTLGQINKRTEKEEDNSKMHFLNKKRLLHYEPIIYDEKMKKILKIFVGTKEELNEFLNHSQIQKISYEDFSTSFMENSNSFYFDPNNWMKSNQIEKRTINLEDLSIYCQDKIIGKNNSKNNKNNKNNNNENFNIKKKEIKEGKNNINIEKNKNNNKLSFFKKYEKIYNNYIEIQKIIACKTLSIEQKNWLNNLFIEISNTDIKDIVIEKDDKGKDNKLEIVFDLDNTCIFSFLLNSDALLVQSKKNIFPQKETKMISFKYKNKVLYAVLIIRKGLKEFIQYIQPLCNFHISTLGAENYGKEILGILSEYSKIKFTRYKGRLYDNELIKNISDLYIEKEKTIIFDDNIRVWDNDKKDYENVIISKFFFDEECVMINSTTASHSPEEKREKSNKIINDPLYEMDLFLNSYRTLFYNKFKGSKNDIDWKEQQVMEHPNIPFYQFKTKNDFNYNKCFIAEYLNSQKYQFCYMKNVIKQLYYLKFIYDIDISLGIKLIRISTLTNMKFDLKYLTIDQKVILTEIVKICGGIIYENNYRINDEKIYLIASKRLYEFKKDEIKKDLANNPYYVLINEKFILDTYYFMTNLKDSINDSEYTFNEGN